MNFNSLCMAGAAIKKHHPQVIEAVPQRTRLDRILAPPLSGVVSTEMSERDMQEACGSLSEWIAMVQLGSPRVSVDDDIDPFLSRYTVPEADQGRTTDLDQLEMAWSHFCQVDHTVIRCFTVSSDYPF